MKKTVTRIIAVAAIFAGLQASAQEKLPVYQDKTRPHSERAEDLLKHLTIEEKTSLMMHHASAVERLGIKQYNWWNEALHGVGRNGSATVYPQPIGMAASFDEKLLNEVFTAVSDEARVKNRQAIESGNGVDIYQGVTFWTPNINIFRDPRWGRGMETYGEDPYLTAVMGMAVVRGLQGDTDADVLKAHACAKHYAVHSGPESTRHSYDAVVSERDLRETYLPAFKDLVTKANVQEVMTAYNRFEGEPCAASTRLVKDILRGEWGYKGMIVSDCWAVDDFYKKGRHNYVETAAHAAAKAILTGVDIECGEAYNHIPEAIEMGLITEEDLDRCLMRSFVARYQLGEMDGESRWGHLQDDIVEGEAHRALSLDMARESIVLLQNKGNVLPLAPGQKIAVMGPNADDAEMMWGNYNPVPVNTVTLLEAMKEVNPDIVSLRGCGIVGSEFMPKDRGMSFDGMTDQQMEDVAKRFGINLADIRNMAASQKKMKESYLPALDVDDVLAKLQGINTVVFAGGISPRFEGEEMPVKVPGFDGGDRTDIELPAVQRQLLKALHDAGKKVILVNFSGSAMALVPETESCDAIVQAWYPGQEGGYAIADILYGKVNPSAKLPVTFYRNVNQLPDFSDYNMAGHTYRYMTQKPLFPFGYGLSYTTFQYGKAKVRNNVLSFKVKNTGKKDGTEVVQLYVSRNDDKEGPAKTLRGFKRVFVPAGKSVEVCFLLGDETFEWWDPQVQNMRPRKGGYTLMYGGSSADEDLNVVSYRY